MYEEVLVVFSFCEVGDCGLHQRLLCGGIFDPWGGTQMMESKLFFGVSTQHHGDNFLLFWKFPSSTNPTS